MRRASSMPAMISIGWPSASRARSRKACFLCALRSALVPTTRTLSACMSRSRWPNRCRHPKARAATSLSMRPFSATPAARRTISRSRSMMISCPCWWRATTMWKLLEPRSTAASTFGSARGALRVTGFSTAARPGATGGTRALRSGGGEGRAAATGGGRIRVADDELRAIEALAVVDLGAHQVLHAHRVDQEPHALVLDAGIAVLDLLVELEAVLQTGAAAALHEHAQHQLRIALALDERCDLAGRGIGEKERRCVLQRFGGAHVWISSKQSLRGRAHEGQNIAPSRQFTPG